MAKHAADVPGSPSSLASSALRGTTVLQGRYKMSYDAVLGEGAFSKVYKGLDTEGCREVAIKVYKESTDADGECFKKNIELLKHVKSLAEANPFKAAAAAEPGAEASAPSRGTSFQQCLLSKDFLRMEGLLEEGVDGSALELVDFLHCFVELLDYSKDSKGKPGLDIDSEYYYLITELAESSLADELSACADRGITFQTSELRKVQWVLVSVVFGLHCIGFTHLDIKPDNIMKFRSKSGKPQWKLIDLDGALQTGQPHNISDLTFTPPYMAPELAKIWLSGDRKHDNSIVLSRLMDVWSVGMCMLEAIFLKPVLGDWYAEWFEETGDDRKFLHWLSDLSEGPIISGDLRDAIMDINPDLGDLLEGMLNRDPSQRSCITACVAHSWFRVVRQEILEELQKAGDKKAKKIKPDEDDAPVRLESKRSWFGGGGGKNGAKFSVACSVM